MSPISTLHSDSLPLCELQHHSHNGGAVCVQACRSKYVQALHLPTAFAPKSTETPSQAFRFTRGMARRAGIFEALEERLLAHQYGSEEEAITIRKDQEARRGKTTAHEANLQPEPQKYLFDVADSDETAEATG